MPNVLNQRMLKEVESFLNEGKDCVVVDFTGMSVLDADAMRTKLKKSDVKMQVVKTSLARIAAKNLGYDGADSLFNGASAMLWGGDGVATVARALTEAVKGKKAPAIPAVRGALLDKKVVGAQAVEALAKLPTRKELLGQVLGTIIAPLSNAAALFESLLTAVPGLTQALHDKMDEKKT